MPRHLKNDPMLTYEAKPFMVNERDAAGELVDSHHATVPEMLRIAIGQYQAMQGKQLSFEELTTLGDVIRKLKGEPDAEGYYVFANDEWNVTVKTFGWMGPLMPWALSSPIVKRAMDAAPENLSPPKESRKNGKVEEPDREAVAT